MLDQTARFTRRCIHGNYRLPVITEKEMFVLEVDREDIETLMKQRNKSIPDAYFGDAVNLLGEYEELGYTPEELRQLISKLGG